MPGKHAPPEVRFWNFVSPCPNTGCWLWDGAVARGGYGKLGRGGKGGGTASAPHVSLAIHGRPKPNPGAFACHHCDTPLCVNPEHLYWGDAHTNNQDGFDRNRKVSPLKGRHGELAPSAMLTEDMVRYVLTSPKNAAELADELGIAHSTARRIRRREIWPHLHVDAPLNTKDGRSHRRPRRPS